MLSRLLTNYGAGTASLLATTLPTLGVTAAQALAFNTCRALAAPQAGPRHIEPWVSDPSSRAEVSSLASTSGSSNWGNKMVNIQSVRTSSSSRPAAGVMQQLSAAIGGSSPGPDPFALVKDELDNVSERLRHAVTSDIPVLGRAAEYFFRVGHEGKRLRPTLILLLGGALSPPPCHVARSSVDLSPPGTPPTELRRRQQRIAEVAEMIHVASLLHDDVIDDSDSRRGLSSLNASMGNKLAILAGDFLLARASMTLASLHNTEIVELLSQVIENLVSGEIMQMACSPEDLVDLEHYTRKSYYKTASLMANSAKAVAKLGDHSPEVCKLAWEYGRHVGLAFQVVDDIIDLTSSSSMMGKPSNNDLKSGIATAPILYAAEEFPELNPLILRKFKSPGDVDRAVDLLRESNGLERARELAAHHCNLAIAAVEAMPAPQGEHAHDCRAALIQIAHRVLHRTK